MSKVKFTSIFTAAAIVSMLFASCAVDTSADGDSLSDTSANGTVSESAAADEPILDIDTSAYEITIDGTKFMVDGKEIYINGVNTPWDNWNDFGGNFDESFWQEHFALLHETGVNASRVWINCSGDTAIKLNQDGTVRQVTQKHWEHLDRFFEIAQENGIYIMATLLSFDHFKDSNVQYKAWREMVSSEEATQSYIDKYLIPFVERYGNNPYLWSIDLMNEPDWVVENEECGQIGWDVLGAFFARCSAAIHDNSSELVTVGLGMVKYNSDNFNGNYLSDEFLQELGGDSAYVDFYSTHYYYWQNAYMGFPFEQSPESFGLGNTKPCVIGETASLDESGRTITERYESAYNNGWNGVMAWTSNGVDNCGGYEDVKPAVESIAELAEDKVFPMGK